MSLAAIQDALDTLLEATPDIDADRIAWPNTAFDPASALYWAPSIVSLTRQQVGYGAHGQTHWRGTYQVSVLEPSGPGSEGLSDLADVLAAQFAGGTRLDAGALVVKLEVPVPIPVFSDAGWAHSGIRVAWFTENPASR